MTKYKFTLTPKIRGYVEWQLEHYQDDKKQLEQYKNDLIPSATAGYSLTGGIQSGSVSNPTEKTSIKLITNSYIQATERSILAIERTLERCDKNDIKLIQLIYWTRSHTPEGAGMVVGLSRQGTYNRINKILTAIALELGIINI